MSAGASGDQQQQQQQDAPGSTKRLVLVVAVALIDEQKRVLLAQRPHGKAMAGLWEFPGGKVCRRARAVQAYRVGGTHAEMTPDTATPAASTPPPSPGAAVSTQVDAGETPEAALCRELQEELSIQVCCCL
jgi:hypothetical protein